MRLGWVISAGAVSLSAMTAIGYAAASAQFSVGVTVIAPCSIRVSGSLPNSRNLSPAPVNLSCADGTRAAVTFEPMAPAPATQTVDTARGLTRVTISY